MSEVIMSESETDASHSFRYYYTDPLAAAWMAKHFGMKFEGGSISAFNCSVFSSGRTTPHYYADDGDDDFRGIIHPDSLHLLEPKVGDIFRCWDNEDPDDTQPYRIVPNQSTPREWTVELQYAGFDDSVTPNEIILRDGKPFFWPEREAI
jgi:hypothetical protein